MSTRRIVGLTGLAAAILLSGCADSPSSVMQDHLQLVRDFSNSYEPDMRSNPEINLSFENRVEAIRTRTPKLNHSVPRYFAEQPNRAT